MEMIRPLRNDQNVSSPAFPIYTSYDRREDVAYHFCRQSLIRNASVALNIQLLIQDNLRAHGLYTRGCRPGGIDRFHRSALFRALSGRIPGMGAVLRL